MCVSILSVADLITHLVFISVGHIIGTGIFSTPSSILKSVGSVGASMMLWVLGFALSFCGLFIWMEFGTMIPRSGGEKVYLEASFKRPRHLATILFATNAIFLGFTASNCIVRRVPSLMSVEQYMTLPCGRCSRLSAYFAGGCLVTQAHLTHASKYTGSCGRNSYPME